MYDDEYQEEKDYFAGCTEPKTCLLEFEGDVGNLQAGDIVVVEEVMAMEFSNSRNFQQSLRTSFF